MFRAAHLGSLFSSMKHVIGYERDLGIGFDHVFINMVDV